MLPVYSRLGGWRGCACLAEKLLLATAAGAVEMLEAEFPSGWLIVFPCLGRRLQACCFSYCSCLTKISASWGGREKDDTAESVSVEIVAAAGRTTASSLARAGKMVAAVLHCDLGALDVLF